VPAAAAAPMVSLPGGRPVVNKVNNLRPVGRRNAANIRASSSLSSSSTATPRRHIVTIRHRFRPTAPKTAGHEKCRTIGSVLAINAGNESAPKIKINYKLQSVLLVPTKHCFVICVKGADATFIY